MQMIEEFRPKWHERLRRLPVSIPMTLFFITPFNPGDNLSGGATSPLRLHAQVKTLLESKALILGLVSNFQIGFKCAFVNQPGFVLASRQSTCQL